MVARIVMETRMDRLFELQTLITADAARMRILRSVRELALPDCWVAAGFVRNCAWDHVHQHATSALPEDIDVIWFDSNDATAARDAALENVLRAGDATLRWSVKNQARMHGRNADQPYRASTDAMRHWPETATAVGVRLSHAGAIEVAAPFGLDDLFDLVVRPTARFTGAKHAIYLERIRAKNWQARWPGLTIAL